MRKKFKEKTDPSNMKIAMLSKLNVGGIFSKAIDREKFIKQQKAAGSTDDRATLKEKFEGAYKTSRGLQKVNKEFDETALRSIIVKMYRDIKWEIIHAHCGD